MSVVVLADVDLGLSQSSYRLVEGQILRNEVCVKVFGDSGASYRFPSLFTSPPLTEQVNLFSV